MSHRSLKWLLVIVGSLVLLMLAILWSLSTGEVSIAIVDIPSRLLDGESMEHLILTRIRIPRILLALSVGGSLSLAGAIMQGIFRNPLVEPYTLGISGGAALGVSFAIVLGLVSSLGIVALPLFGFLGAISTIFIVFAFSRMRNGVNIHNMLLVGIMISFVASALMMLLMSITSRDNMNHIMFWTMGSLDQSDFRFVILSMVTALVGLLVSYAFVHTLNALRLGESKARYLGLNVQASIRLLFFIASMLTGVSVAVAGIIGFVGLVIPHIVRMVSGNDHRILLGASFMGGATFLVVCDTLSRLVIAPNELPIGVITGIAGGVVFIFVLLRNRKKRYA